MMVIQREACGGSGGVADDDPPREGRGGHWSMNDWAAVVRRSSRMFSMLTGGVTLQEGIGQ